MRAIVLPLVLIPAGIAAALFVLYLAIPLIGADRANAAANAVLVVGGLGMMAGGGWAMWRLQHR